VAQYSFCSVRYFQQNRRKLSKHRSRHCEYAMIDHLVTDHFCLPNMAKPADIHSAAPGFQNRGWTTSCIAIVPNRQLLHLKPSATSAKRGFQKLESGVCRSDYYFFQRPPSDQKCEDKTCPPQRMLSSCNCFPKKAKNFQNIMSLNDDSN